MDQNQGLAPAHRVTSPNPKSYLKGLEFGGRASGSGPAPEFLGMKPQ